MRVTARQVERIAGNIIAVRARNVRYGEMAVVESPLGQASAQVIRLVDDLVYLQVFSGTAGISSSARVQFLGRTASFVCSDDALGRAFTGAGEPRDGKPPLFAEPDSLEAAVVNPVRRSQPRNMIHTGIPMIDVFNSLVESQKISIFTVAGEPYHELMARVAAQAEVDRVVLGGMGLRHDDYLFFRDRFRADGSFARSVMIVHTASDPVVECLLAPSIALTVAEKYALRGERVLVLLSDMTNYCDALKEVAVTMEQIPSNRGYPGDLYSRLATLYERAVDFEGSGSVTILSATTMPGNDVTHPVPDNTGYITEGQYYLINGRIEPFGSLSRLKQLVNKDTRADHRTVMDAMIRLYADYQEALEKKAMGFRLTAWDEKLIQYGGRFEKELMDLNQSLPLAEALDLGWRILADCFDPVETGIPSDMIQEHWPKTPRAENATDNATDNTENALENASGGAS